MYMRHDLYTLDTYVYATRLIYTLTRTLIHTHTLTPKTVNHDEEKAEPQTVVLSGATN